MRKLMLQACARGALLVGCGGYLACSSVGAETAAVQGVLPAAGGNQLPAPMSAPPATPAASPTPSTGEVPNVGGLQGMLPMPAPGVTPATPPPPAVPEACREGMACLPAFPGADGAGGFVTGGRGGDVYHVTLVDTDSSDQRPGTLRFGLTNVTAPRTIVFDVSGVFHLGRLAVAGWSDNGNGWDTTSRLNIPDNVTIAGQSAPGPVVITGGLIKAGGENFILRNVTIAPGYGSRGFDEPELPAMAGDFPDTYVYDAIDITGKNLIIDHVTTVYATDETISMNESVDNVTVQFSNISQGQNYPQADAEASGVRYTGHALGSLTQGGSNARVSIHHNLYAHQKGRLPRVGTEADALTVPGVGAFNDFRNNVFYNWYDTAGTGASGQAHQSEFVGNFYLAGPGGVDPTGGAETGLLTKAGGTRIFDGKDALNSKVFHQGNLKDLNLDGDALDGVPATDADFIASALQPVSFGVVPYTGVTDAADVALGRVLDFAGSRYWERAAIDARIVAEVRAGSGRILAWADDPFDPSPEEGAEWRALSSSAGQARGADFDTDQDGMPDAWEAEHQLSPSTPDNNGDFDTDGYTNLEEYLNELAAWPAPTPASFTGEQGTRYAQIQNWSLITPAGSPVSGGAPWQPGRFDRAQILSGVVSVDAVGQHAGTLEVSSPRGLAVLNVSAGWLEVSRSLVLGAHAASGALLPGAGQLNQSGGRVSARSVVLGAAGQGAAEYNLQGGVLSARRVQKQLPSAGFHFSGGTLHADEVGFDLVNRGGVLQPGRLTAAERRRAGAASFGQLRVAGRLRLESGALRVALGEHGNDGVVVDGDLELGGALEIERLSPGREPADGWVLLSASGAIRGAFRSVPAGYRVSVVGPRVLLVRERALVAAERALGAGGLALQR